METCTAEFQRLASQVGGIDCTGSPLVTFTSPFALDHWTMPLIEVTLIVGAAACLGHALRWKRAHDDASNLVVWLSGILALLLIEPIAYFPQWFGVEEELGLTFIHNQFSVQFFYNRLPLYIVAMYPVFVYVAYVLVQRTGVFEQHNAIVGAMCVAFAFHVLYETIDMVGPQLRWWVWNRELQSLGPWLASVPYVCMQAFGIGIPLGIGLLSRWLATGRGQSGWRIAANVVVISVGTWPVMFITSIPAVVLTLAGVSMEKARIAGVCLLLATAALVTAWALADAYRARIRGEVELPEGIEADRFALVCVAAYMVVAAICWIAAMPAYIEARDGFTPAGAPIGWFPYSLSTAALSIAIVAATYLGRAPAHTVPKSVVRFGGKVATA
jgi:hypothetical protein